MKSLKITLAFLLFFVLKTTAQQIKQVEMQVTGLTCSMCSQATEKSVRSLPYVANVTPDLNKNLFLITFKAPSAVNVDQLQKKVEDAGFFVGKLQATVSFNQVKIDETGQAIVDGKIYRFTNLKSKVLDGNVVLNFIDQKFIPSSSFKKYSQSVKLDSYATGMAVVAGKKSRVYHVSI